jgi:hypothetical protein
MQGALININRGIIAVRVAAAMLGISAVAAAVQALQLLTTPVMLAGAAVVGLLLAADKLLQRWKRQLTFTNYVHAERD